MNPIKLIMLNKFVFILPLLVLIPIAANAQVLDETVGGVIVPNATSTQVKYCFTGICHGSPQTQLSPFPHAPNTLPILLVKLSNTCEILDKNNMTGCPTVKSLISYDTSNQNISGKFVNHDGIYFRDPPQIKNNWLFYQYSNLKIICVECYMDLPSTVRSQQIIINPNSFSYVNKTETESKGMTYNYFGRYMDECSTATISNIPGLLDDTIKYMVNGCINSATSFNNTQVNTRPLHLINYYSPYSTTNQDTYLKTIFNGHTYDFGNKTKGGRGLANCITNQCDFKDPYKKAGW